MRDPRLGDVIDDFCVKCRRLTNHAIVSLLHGQAAKVRCRTCYGDHDYRHEIAPPTKKELLKQKELFNAVLAGMAPAVPSSETPAAEPVAGAAAAAAPAAKPGKLAASKTTKKKK
jgi:hypothetical protein